MKKIKVLYWIFTGLFAFVILGAAVPQLFSMPISVEGVHHLGYPPYILPFVGIAKTLAIFAVLFPGFPTIKEWAYAGLFADLSGATYSILVVGASQGSWVVMLIPLTLGVLSYVFYRKKLTSQNLQPIN